MKHHKGMCGCSGPDRRPLIIGLVVGVTCLIILAAAVTHLAFRNARSYRFRAYKRLIEDHVHTLVLGLRSEHLMPRAQSSYRIGVGGQDSDGETEDSVNARVSTGCNCLPCCEPF